MSEARRLPELAWVFLRLGLLSFGGPAAHIALMEEEFVKRRRWLSHERFVDLLGAVNLIPGPNSTEMAIHIGHLRGGWRGLIVAGACFILPAALLTWLLAVLYVSLGSLPPPQRLFCERVFNGLKPIIIVIVLQALVKLTPKAVPDTTTFLVAAVVALLNFLAGTREVIRTLRRADWDWLADLLTVLGGHELALLAAAGVLVMLVRWRPRPPAPAALLAAPTGSGLVLAASTAATPSVVWVFLVFLKVGAVLFGSGYVLLAFLRADLVEPNGPLSERQLLDAVAVGQITPGPVFSTATFIGYLLAGTPGSIAATVGIFLPAFLFVAVSGPLVPRLRRSPLAGAFLDGVNAASLALMAVVTIHLGRAALTDVPTCLLAIAAALLLWRLRLNTLWLMGLGLVVGLAMGLLGHMGT
jgi:chromate transporter